MTNVVPFSGDASGPNGVVPSIQRREWCMVLSALVSPAFQTEAAKALAAMLPHMTHIAEDLFTNDTAQWVARAKRRQSVPAYDEILIALDAYRETFIHRPVQRITAPVTSRDAPTQAEIDHVARALTGLRADLNEQRIAREAQEVRVSPPPLRDVTLKGAALDAVRAARINPLRTERDLDGADPHEADSGGWQ